MVLKRHCIGSTVANMPSQTDLELASPLLQQQPVYTFEFGILILMKENIKHVYMYLYIYTEYIRYQVKDLVSFVDLQ